MLPILQNHQNQSIYSIIDPSSGLLYGDCFKTQLSVRHEKCDSNLRWVQNRVNSIIFVLYKGYERKKKW